jgi:hypothetical protein
MSQIYFYPKGHVFEGKTIHDLDVWRRAVAESIGNYQGKSKHCLNPKLVRELEQAKIFPVLIPRAEHLRDFSLVEGYKKASL